MKQTKILGALAIAIAAVGAFAFKSPTRLTDAYPSNNCSSVTTLPTQCNTTSSRTCTVEGITYYQQSGCVNEFKKD
jgi:hypothetical protein